jgi:hypothetical protein
MSGLGGHSPDHGGRVSLELSSSNTEGASYTATLRSAEATWQALVKVDAANGAVTWAGAGTESAPTWMTQLAVALLRAAWRAHHGQRWPRRITRWRAARED